MSRRLENLIASVAPGWAAARAANRLRLNFSEQKAEAIGEMLAMAAHDSAEYSRVTADWNTRLLSSDQAVIADQPTAIARSRDAIRNDGTAGSIVEVPEALLAEVETPEMLEYGRMIRSTYPSGAAQTNA